MQDLDRILLLYSLRVALVSLESNPKLDHEYPGIRDLTRSLKQQIRMIEKRSHVVNDGWLLPDPAMARKAALKPKPPATVPANASLALNPAASKTGRRHSRG